MGGYFYLAEVSIFDDSLTEKAKQEIERSTSAVIGRISTDEVPPVGTIRVTLYSIPIEFYVIKNEETIFTKNYGQNFQ